MTSTVASTQPSARSVRRAAVVTHGSSEAIGSALARLSKVAEEMGVECLFSDDEVAKHALPLPSCDVADAEIAVVLGGDGTMLRALQRFLGTGIPVIGVNFGRVGFLASMPPDELESGLARVFAGEYTVTELPTLALEVNGKHAEAVNDVVVTSGEVGRMIELDWAIGGESMGAQPCDGMIVCTPSGSTAYNLSNGGPVLVWGLDAMAVTFVAPHSLHARPLVCPRGRDLVVENETAAVAAAVIVDGHPVGKLTPDSRATVGLGERFSLLASLPEVTFFRRYHETFAS
jgi:NAD+ kinase